MFLLTIISEMDILIKFDIIVLIAGRPYIRSFIKVNLEASSD